MRPTKIMPFESLNCKKAKNNIAKNLSIKFNHNMRNGSRLLEPITVSYDKINKKSFGNKVPNTIKNIGLKNKPNLMAYPHNAKSTLIVNEYKDTSELNNNK